MRDALREDLEVSHRAVTHWAAILEGLSYMFRVRPFGGSHARSLKKLLKAYQVTLEGARDFVEAGVRVLPASRFLSALV